MFNELFHFVMPLFFCCCFFIYVKVTKGCQVPCITLTFFLFIFKVCGTTRSLFVSQSKKEKKNKREKEVLI